MTHYLENPAAIDEWLEKYPNDMEEALRRINAGRPDFLYCLYSYCFYLLPDSPIVVEVGTQWAESTVFMGRALKKKGGHLYSMDPAFKPGGIFYADAGQSGGHMEVSLERVQGFIDGNGLHDVVTLIPDYSESVLSTWTTPIDAVHIDGQHTYDAVKIDCGWLEHVKSGGYAIFDDWIDVVQNSTKDYMADKPEWRLIHASTSARRDYYAVTIFQKDGNLPVVDQ